MSALKQPGKPKRVTRQESSFPNRAIWLQQRLFERAWDHNDPPRHSGPDRKTIDKILRGEPVREDVLEKLAKALSRKFGKVWQPTSSGASRALPTSANVPPSPSSTACWPVNPCQRSTTTSTYLGSSSRP